MFGHLEQSVVLLQRVLFSILKAHVLKFDSWNGMLWTTLKYATPVFILSTIYYTLINPKDDPNETKWVSPLMVGTALTICSLVAIYWYREHLMFKEILETSPYRMFGPFGIILMLLMALSVLHGRFVSFVIILVVFKLLVGSQEDEYNFRQKEIGILLSRLVENCPDIKIPCNISGQIDGKFLQYLDSSTPDFLQTIIQTNGGWSAIMKSLVKLEKYQNTMSWVTNPFGRIGDSFGRSIGIMPKLKSAIK